MTKVTEVKRRAIPGALVVVAIFLALNVHGGSVAIANAAPRATGYEISWYTVDGGGAMNLTGGSYTLSGTIGQPDAGLLSAGVYSLGGGFWGSGALAPGNLFLPLILR